MSTVMRAYSMKEQAEPRVEHDVEYHTKAACIHDHILRMKKVLSDQQADEAYGTYKEELVKGSGIAEDRGREHLSRLA
jgi:hypothetical protein